MVLRDHPLMSYRGVSNWPPRWHARGDGVAPQALGEVGMLTEVTIHQPAPQYHSPTSLFIFMEHKGHRYIAALIFSDGTFCRQLGNLLKNYYGRTLAEIGGLDVSGLL